MAYSKMNLIVVSTWIMAILAAHIVTLKAVYLQGIADKIGKPLKAVVEVAQDKPDPAPMSALEEDLLEHVFANAAVPEPVVADVAEGPRSLGPI
jgi:hypothetical protein